MNSANVHLYDFANRVFLIGLSKFPNCTSLRIFYAIFLWDNFKQKNNSLQEFSIAEKNNPPFDQQFIIFRYKKIISEEEERGHSNEALDIVSGIAYDSHFKQCQNNIKKASQLYLDFWEHLNPSNSSPDIAKLNDLALKINNTITSIEIHWKNMQALKPNDPKALKIFSGFLIEVLNDKEKGNELLSLWRETADKKQTYVGYLEIELDYQLLNYVKEGHALVLCSAEPDTFGNIIKFSHVTSKIFGYTTSEIYGKNIEYLFLECYYSKLCFYFQQILNKVQIDSKSELFFGRSKYHYAIPLNISIREYKGTRSDQKCFILVIKNITNMIDLRNNIRTGYFIVDSRLKIVNYSSLTYEFITQFFVKMSSDNYYYLYEFFPEIYTQNHMEMKLCSSSMNKRGTIFSPSAKLLEEYKQNDFINIMENKDIRNDFIRINVKNTLFFKNNKSLTIIANKNPDIKTVCEKDSYKVELSLHPLVGLNFVDGLINKNHNNTEILKQSMTTEQGILEEDDDSKMYAVTMKIHLYEDKNDVVLPINYIEKEIFPKLDEISAKISASNYKSFLELLKSGKNNIFSFYAVSKEGQKLTEMVEKFNFGGLALLNKTKEDENFSDSENEYNSEEDSNDESDDSDGSNVDNEDDNESEEEDDIVKTNEFYTPQQILKGEEFSKMKTEEFKRIIEKLIDYGKKVSYRIIKDNGFEENPSVGCQIKEFLKSKNTIISHEETSAQTTVKTTEILINPQKKTSQNTKTTTPVTLLRLSNSTVVILMILISYVIFEFILYNNYFEDFKSNFALMQISFQAIYQFQNSLFLLRNIILSNNPSFTNFMNMTREEFKDYNFLQLTDNQNNLTLIRNQLFINTNKVMDEHLNLLTKPIVPILFKTSNNTFKKSLFNLIDAFKIVDTTLLTIITNGKEKIQDSVYDVNEFIYNSLNEFMYFLTLSANYFVQMIQTNSSFIQKIYIVVYVVAILISISSVIIIYCFLVQVELDRTKILGSFYAIPNYYVKWLSERCGTFLNKMQKMDNNMNDGSEGEENDLNMDIEEIEKNYSTGARQRIPRKVGDKQGSRVYLLKIFFVFSIILVFFTVIFAVNIVLLKKIKILNNVYNTTSIGYVNYSETINIVREKFVDPKMSLFLNNSNIILNTSLEMSVNINNKILYEHLINNDVFDSSYISLYESILHNSLCDISDQINNNIKNCYTKANSLSKFGFKMIMARYFELLNNVINDFYLYQQSNNFTLDNTIANLNKEYMDELDIISYDFIKNTMNLLCDNLLNGINTKIDSCVNINMIIFIVFIIFLVTGYLIIWMPFESRLKDDISRTKMMLAIIPDNVLKKVEFLKKIA